MHFHVDLAVQLCNFFFFLINRAATALYTFPYTTLFRSRAADGGDPHAATGPLPRGGELGGHLRRAEEVRSLRSEEHTSELQSRLHLVCRLLLEKKKTTVIITCRSAASDQTSTVQNAVNI